METIAPLAKVLAEANGIEWRSLHGTGEAGLITEADILGYLARVMSGEEDAPLTPVDPMPSPAELAAYSSPELLSRAGVEPELAEFLKAQQGQMQDLAASAPVVLSPTPPEPVLAQPVPEEPVLADPVMPEPVMPEPAMPEPVVAEPMVAEAEPELELEPVSLEPVSLEPVSVEPVSPEPLYVEPLPVLAEPEPAPLVAAEHDDDEFELEDEAPMPPPTAPTAPAKPAATGGLLSGLLSSLYRRNEAPKPAPVQPAANQPAANQPAAAQSTPFQPAPVQPNQPNFVPPAATQPAEIQPVQPAAMQTPVSLPEVLPEPEVAAPDYADVVPPISSDSSGESGSDERLMPPAPVLGEVIEPEPAVQAALPAEPQTAPVMPAPQPYVQPQPHSQMQSPAAAWSGTYLRRNTDLSALISARDQLTELLGDVPLSLMVARAAQRHLGLLDLSSLAVANAQGQALGADLSGGLRGSLTALQNAQPDTQMQADLLILDAGALDLDDLHYPHAVTLSLGRVVDNQAALSLNGNLDVQQAALFLAEVSALLGTPVKLLV